MCLNQHDDDSSIGLIMKWKYIWEEVWSIVKVNLGLTSSCSKTKSIGDDPEQSLERFT